MLRPLNKVKPCRVGLVLGSVTDQLRIPCDVIIFFLFFSFLFQGDLRTAELPSFCNVVSSIYHLFVLHFAMAVFMSIYLHSRHRRTSTFGLGGAVTLLPEKKYTMPESMCCTNALKSH